MTDAKLINAIQRIRRKNNVHWMNIIRIAIKHAPKETKAQLASISSNDAAVTKLSRRLAK